jgi:hypothetical protein
MLAAALLLDRHPEVVEESIRSRGESVPGRDFTSTTAAGQPEWWLERFRQRGRFVDQAIAERIKLAESRGVMDGETSFGGRLLVCDVESSLNDGLPRMSSGDFFDVDEQPPPVCWVAYSVDWAAVRERRYLDATALIAYIPAGWVERVERGISACAIDNIRWLEVRRV